MSLTTRDKNRKVLLISTLGVAGVCAAVLAAAGGPKEPVEGKHTFPITGHALLGNPNQGTEIVLFVDYNCPACKDFETDHLPAIIEHLIKPGLAHLYLFQSPFIAPSSKDLAVAAQCALNQNQQVFWRYNKLLFSRNADEHAPAPHQELRELAEQAGLNLPAWERCLKNPDAMQAVMRDLQTHQQANMLGTPAVFVGGLRTKPGSRNIATAIQTLQATQTPPDKETRP